MASKIGTLRSSGRVSRPQDTFGMLLSEVASHTKDRYARHTDCVPFGPDMQDGYGLHLEFDKFTKKVESARLAIPLLRESPAGQQYHSAFASTLRQFVEALRCISATYAGTEGRLWDRELWQAAQKCWQRLEPLLMLLPPITTRLALLNTSERQTILQLVAVWASKEDEFCRVQVELASGVEFITSRLELINREKRDDLTLAIDTVSEEPSKATTVTEVSSITSSANVANGLPSCDKPSSFSASVAASGRQRSPSDSGSLQDRLRSADLSGAHHWLQQGISDGAGSVSCSEVFHKCDEAKDFGHGNETCSNRTVYDFACLHSASYRTMGSWTESSHALSDELEMLIPSSPEPNDKLESRGGSSCIGPESHANRNLPLGECGCLGSEYSTLDGLVSSRTEAGPGMADQLGEARHGHSYSMGRWSKQSSEDPWSPARPNGKRCSCRIDYNPNLSSLAESQGFNRHTHRAGLDNLHVDAFAAPEPSGPSEDDSVVALFEDLSLRQNDDRKHAPTQFVGCANGAQEPPTPPHGACGSLGPSDKRRGKRKADQNNSNSEKGSGNSEDRDGDSGDGGGPGERRRSWKPKPKTSAGYLPCIYRDTIGRHLSCYRQQWSHVWELKVHLASCKHNILSKDMEIGKGGTEEEKWKRLYEKLRGQPAPHPLKWMLDTLLEAIQQSTDESLKWMRDTLLEAMQQSTDDPHIHYGQSRPGDDSRYLEQLRSVPFGELIHERSDASPEVVPPILQSDPFDQINNAHVRLSLNDTTHPWVSHTKGHMMHKNPSDTLEHAHDYRPPTYGHAPLETAVNQWQPTTAMYAPTSEPRFEEPMFEGYSPWTSTFGEKNLSEAPRVDVSVVTDTAYPGSETRSLSAPNSCSNPSLLTAPTSWGEDLPDLEGCTCLQHSASCVDDYHKGECLCRGCDKMIPLFCAPELDARLRVCQ